MFSSENARPRAGRAWACADAASSRARARRRNTNEARRTCSIGTHVRRNPRNDSTYILTSVSNRGKRRSDDRGHARSPRAECQAGSSRHDHHVAELQEGASPGEHRGEHCRKRAGPSFPAGTAGPPAPGAMADIAGTPSGNSLIRKTLNSSGTVASGERSSLALGCPCPPSVWKRGRERPTLAAKQTARAATQGSLTPHVPVSWSLRAGTSLDCASTRPR